MVSLSGLLYIHIAHASSPSSCVKGDGGAMGATARINLVLDRDVAEALRREVPRRQWGKFVTQAVGRPCGKGICWKLSKRVPEPGKRRSIRDFPASTGS